MRATLRDVAERAGVSPSTACRALQGHEHIHPATRARVLSAATELNYVPNRLARSLVRRRSDLVGFVLFDIANPFFASVARGIEEVVRGVGYDLMLACSYRDQQQEHNALDLLQRLQADGFIITPALEDVSRLEHARDTGRRFVVAGRAVPELGVPFAAVNDVHAGQLAAEHLIRLGRKRIAFVGGGQAGNVAEHQRLQGFTTCLTHAGATLDADDVVAVGSSDLEGGTRAADRLLEMSQRPDAVVAANDLLAIGLIHRLLEQGIGVPDEIAVVGFDDIPFARYAEVPLTTVALPQYELGRAAAGMLMDMLDDKDAPEDEPMEAKQLFLEPNLVVRRSCGGG